MYTHKITVLIGKWIGFGCSVVWIMKLTFVIELPFIRIDVQQSTKG